MKRKQQRWLLVFFAVAVLLLLASFFLFDFSVDEGFKSPSSNKGPNSKNSPSRNKGPNSKNSPSSKGPATKKNMTKSKTKSPAPSTRMASSGQTTTPVFKGGQTPSTTTP